MAYTKHSDGKPGKREPRGRQEKKGGKMMLSSGIAMTLGDSQKIVLSLGELPLVLCTTGCNNLVTPIYTTNTCIRIFVQLYSFCKIHKE